MKKLLLLVFLFCTSFGFAQEYAQEEIAYEGNGIITKKDGSKVEGTIRYSFMFPNKVKYTLPDGTSDKIKIKEISEFTIDDMIFENLETPGLAIGGEGQMCILKTPADYKIKIYESISQNMIGNGKGYAVEREYLVKFPTLDKVKGLGDLSFTPFNKKVAALVNDCPSLQEKIASKEKGYKIGLVSTSDMKLTVFMKIADEYQTCK